MRKVNGDVLGDELGDPTGELAANDAGDAAPPPLQFQDVTEFVSEYITVVYNRGIKPAGTHWCPQWWKHPEAVEVFTGLWEAWEHMRVNDGPTWLVKYKSYFYPLMREITGPDGPFQGCNPDGHVRLPEFPVRLPHDDAPKGVFAPRDDDPPPPDPNPAFCRVRGGRGHSQSPPPPHASKTHGVGH